MKVKVKVKTEELEKCKDAMEVLELVCDSYFNELYEKGTLPWTAYASEDGASVQDEDWP